jgi:hypothetical protein
MLALAFPAPARAQAASLAGPGAGVSGVAVDAGRGGSSATPVLTIRLPQQRAGWLTLEVVEGDRVSVVDIGAADSLVVLPRELRLGASGGERDYVIRVPRVVTAVQVVVGGRAPVLFRPRRPGERFTVRLGPEA